MALQKPLVNLPVLNKEKQTKFFTSPLTAKNPKLLSCVYRLAPLHGKLSS